MLPGANAQTYAAWAAAVLQFGGVPTTRPHGSVADITFLGSIEQMIFGGQTGLPEPNVPAAKYGASTWVPRVDALDWPQPDDYSNDGQWAFYLAPAAVLHAASGLTAPTDDEVSTGAKILEDGWFQKIQTLLGETGIMLSAGVVLYLLVTRRK